MFFLISGHRVLFRVTSRLIQIKVWALRVSLMDIECQTRSLFQVSMHTIRHQARWFFINFSTWFIGFSTWFITPSGWISVAKKVSKKNNEIVRPLPANEHSPQAKATHDYQWIPVSISAAVSLLYTATTMTSWLAIVILVALDLQSLSESLFKRLELGEVLYKSAKITLNHNREQVNLFSIYLQQHHKCQSALRYQSSV